MPPAILLLLLAVATVLVEIAMAGAVVRETLRSFELFGADQRSFLTCLSSLGLAVVFAVHLFVLIGTIKMCRIAGYGGAKAAAVISLIPVLSPGYLLGIPVAIWALIALSRPGVKESFHRNLT